MAFAIPSLAEQLHTTVDGPGHTRGYRTMRRRVTSRFIALPLLLATVGSTVDLAARSHEPSLHLTGCLLLSRKVGVFALHMEYNRIAVMGHADLAHHVRRRVTLTGTFEEQGDDLRFLVEGITEVAPTCDTPVTVSTSAVVDPVEG